MSEKSRHIEQDITAEEIPGAGKKEKREQRASLGPSQEIIRFIETYRDEFQPGDEVLELGVGEGRNLEAFQDPKLNLHGIELDPQGVEMCRQRMAEKGIEADIKEGSFTDLSAFKDGSMKVVFSQYAIQNARTWEDIQNIFTEIRRVLKPTGLYFFREQKYPFIKDADRQRRVAYFTKEEIQQLADQFSLEIIEDKTPIKTRDDPQRVGGKQVVWDLVFRKKPESK
ncbi:MAG: class I SAM-dependent methyltransferase [Candidatus Thorarchaeota archaeon]